MKKRHSNQGLRKVCGCPRRTWAKCRHAWHFNFKMPHGGTSYRFSLDTHLGRHVDSKTEAEHLAAELRTAIRAGRFGQPRARQAMTLRELADTYLDRYVTVAHPDTMEDFRSGLCVICDTPLPRPTGGAAPFGEWGLADIVTDTVERYREARRARGTGIGGTNRSLSRLRALYNWAIRVGYVDHTPFKRGTEPVVRLARETPRSRRLNADIDEEATLLAACGPRLRAVVETALETGMRRGEILSLRWTYIKGMHVDGSTVTWAPRAELVLPWTKTKTRRDRSIPISSRLKGILEWRGFDPAGQPMPATSYVFGNEIGQRVKSVSRAWHTAVLKAHGYEPSYTPAMNLTVASRAALALIDLHFHDLRREAGSRWLEGGVPLHTVRDWLGHTSIAQTSTYLASTMKTQHDAMQRYEDRRAALQPCATDVGTGGRKSPPSAVERERTSNKTAVGREPAIM